MKNCPNCGWDLRFVNASPIPCEPPIGTWMRDRHGAITVRCENGLWAPAPTGWFACAKWEPMWKARGPLTICGPYGRPLNEPTGD